MLVAVGWWSVSVDIVIYLSSVHDWILLDYGKRVIPLQYCLLTNTSTNNNIGIILRWWIVTGNTLIQFMKLQVHWRSSVFFSSFKFDFSSSCVSLHCFFLRPLSWGLGRYKAIPTIKIKIIFCYLYWLCFVYIQQHKSKFLVDDNNTEKKDVHGR